MSYLIDLKNICKEYVLGEVSFLALKNVHLRFGHGEMTAIMGASGSGKSTLMSIIGLLDRSTSGEYFFSGQDVSRLGESKLAKIRNQNIGFIFQSFFLLPRVNVLRNVMLPLFYRRISEYVAKEKALQMLAKVGIEDLANHFPQQLSGGQQQRVAIARALVGEPEVILADEPTGALDSQTGQETIQLFAQLNRNENKTIVIITHDQQVSRQCRRIVTIKDGRILLEGGYV